MNNTLVWVDMVNGVFVMDVASDALRFVLTLRLASIGPLSFRVLPCDFKLSWKEPQQLKNVASDAGIKKCTDRDA